MSGGTRRLLPRNSVGVLRTRSKCEGVQEELPGGESCPKRRSKKSSLKVAYESQPNERNIKDPQDCDLKKSKWEPKDWREQLENIRELRKGKDAPVDEMGAEKCFDRSAAPEGYIKLQRCLCTCPADLLQLGLPYLQLDLPEPR